MRLSRRVAFVASLVGVLGAPSAAGALTIGRGYQPGVAVDGAGTAYIAWRGPENTSSLEFCRLPRGATACDSRHAIAAPGNSVSRAFVAVNGSRVVVVQHRYDAGVFLSRVLYEFISTDGGITFDAGRPVGQTDFDDAAVGPGDTMSGIANTSSVFQNAPLDGTFSLGNGAVLSTDHPYNGSVGFVDAATPLSVFTDGSDAAQYRRYDGSGNLNDVANWTPPVDLGVARYPKLASGPTGLFLVASALDNTVFVRKWNGTTFGAPVNVAGGASAPTLHAFQDAAGRLHVVFKRGASGGLHLIYAVSDDGSTWRSGTVLTQTDGDIAHTRVATAPDHIGVAVWSNAGQTQDEVRVAAVGPDAPATAPMPMPTPTPTPTPTPVTKPPVAEVIPKAGQAIRLPSAKKCISRKGVRVKFVRPPGSPVVKRIEVFLDGKSVKVVKGFVASATVNLKRLPAKRFTFKVVLTYANGKKLTAVRKYKPCTKRTRPKR